MVSDSGAHWLPWQRALTRVNRRPHWCNNSDPGFKLAPRMASVGRSDSGSEEARLRLGPDARVRLGPDAEDHAPALGEGDGRGLDPADVIRVAGSRACARAGARLRNEAAPSGIIRRYVSRCHGVSRCVTV